MDKLLTALQECTKWGQVFVLDCLSNDNPKDDQETQSVCEQVTPQLSHANSAVVLPPVKVLMKFLELLLKDSEYYNTLLKKLAAPFAPLLSGEPEVRCLLLLNVILVEDGEMKRQVFLDTWKDSPSENELQIKECHLNADTVSSKFPYNNIYTIAKRNLEGQDML
ncbi:AP-2 complex subunit beta [Fukomys damarensis]|uniref:AP-2 complex subunit beta n=1 Tax=Fukomys damarensis TaxID=885580 RepID=A0A091D5H8_FUKDA|nr:AP-2 complex subunit beta [Fukomys damarensis]